MPLCLPRCRAFLPGVDPSPRVALIHERNPDSRSLSKRSFSTGITPGIVLPGIHVQWSSGSCAPGWSLLRADDSELTCAIVTLPRVTTTLWPRDSRDALRNVDCHYPRHGRNVDHIQRARLKTYLPSFCPTIIAELPWGSHPRHSQIAGK